MTVLTNVVTINSILKNKEKAVFTYITFILKCDTLLSPPWSAKTSHLQRKDAGR